MHRISGGEAIETEFQQTYHTCTVREDGVTLVRGSFRYPTSESWTLYDELAKNAEEWLRSFLAPKAAEEYRADTSPQKRFFFPVYEYRFEVCPLTQTENEVMFSLTATLSRRKSTDILSRAELRHRFRLPDLILLPQKQKKHRH